MENKLKEKWLETIETSSKDELEKMLETLNDIILLNNKLEPYVFIKDKIENKIENYG